MTCRFVFLTQIRNLKRTFGIRESEHVPEIQVASDVLHLSSNQRDETEMGRGEKKPQILQGRLSRPSTVPQPFPSDFPALFPVSLSPIFHCLRSPVLRKCFVILSSSLFSFSSLFFFFYFCKIFLLSPLSRWQSHA